MCAESVACSREELKKLAEEVLLDLVREKVRDEGIENLIDYPKGYVVIKIPLDYYANMLRFEYKLRYGEGR